MIGMATYHHFEQNNVPMLVTANTLKRLPVFSIPANAREAIDVLYDVQGLRPFFLFGFVFMPDHCHLLVKIPEPETISRIMNRFKMGVSHRLGLGPIWQPRFHVRIAHNPIEALRYINLNPVRKHFVQSAGEFPWSSASGKWDVTPLDTWG